MINSSLPGINVLDLKKNNAQASAKEAANKKASKGKGFGDELVEKQKKLKKKDDDLGPVQQSKSDRQDKTVSKDDNSQAPSGKKAATVDTVGAERGKVAAQGEVAAQPINQEGEVAQQMAMTAEEAALSEIKSADFAKNLTGKISLEGFQLVEPQVMMPEVAQASPAETAALEALKSLATNPEAVTNKAEANLKDMLSQKQEGGEAAQLSTADLFQATATQTKENQHINFASAMKAQSAEAMNNVRQANVDNIVSQARTILKDGGGEMQVVLNPEGLGTVDLKVGVDKGQVTVEILTQDKHVKKLFDDSLSDIRTALEGHNLKVDTLKVNISENFDAQQQMSNGQFDMMEREFAREFLGQFRDERQGFRTAGMADKLNGNGMQPSKPEGIKPAARPVAGNGRLNVVV